MKGWCNMNKDYNSKSAYDDGNIPEIDLPQDDFSNKNDYNVEPLPDIWLQTFCHRFYNVSNSIPSVNLSSQPSCSIKTHPSNYISF